MTARLVIALSAMALSALSYAQPASAGPAVNAGPASETWHAAYTTAPSITPPSVSVGRLTSSPHGSFRLEVAIRTTLASRADRVVVQLSVADPTGRAPSGLLLGSLHRVHLDSAGVGAAILVPDAAQTVALRRWITAHGDDQAASAVRIGVRQEADTLPAPGRESLAIASARVRWGGARPTTPPVPRTDTGDITMTNNTSHPLVLLSGGFSCIYDSLYLATYSTNHASYVGELNGTVLPAGRTITSPIQKDASDLDWRDSYAISTRILQDWTAGLTNAYNWMAASGNQPSLPTLALPDESYATARAELVSQMLAATFTDTADAKANAADFYNYFTLASGFGFAFADAFEALDAIPILDQVFAIIGDIIAIADDLCSSTHDGYFMVGASDMAQPWRQFSGVYNWHEGNIQLPMSKDDTPWTPYANGMVSYPQTQLDSDYTTVAADGLQSLVMPARATGGHPQWIFTEPDAPYQAALPPVVTLQGRQASCALPPADVRTQTASLNTLAARGTSWFLTQFPQAAWQPVNATSPSQFQLVVPPASPAAPNNYADALGYLPPQAVSTVRFYLSPDGQNWDDSVLLAAGTSTYTIPTTVHAAVLQCTMQAAETFSGVTSANGRRVLLGTRLMSSIVPGPDY